MNEESVLKGIYKEVTSRISYHHSGKVKSPSETMDSGKGDCHDQALLVYSLCKEKGLDANGPEEPSTKLTTSSMFTN